MITIFDGGGKGCSCSVCILDQWNLCDHLFLFHFSLRIGYCYWLLCIIMSIDLLAPVLCSHLSVSVFTNSWMMAFSFSSQLFVHWKEKMILFMKNIIKDVKRRTNFFFFLALQLYSNHHKNVTLYVFVSICDVLLFYFDAL